MNATMGFRNYRELEEAYNNLESEYLLRQNTSLFVEMHNYISENIVELPYDEIVFTEASSQNILEKIWNFIVKCWKNLVSFISKIGNIIKRLVSNSEKTLDRLDKLIEMNANHMGLNPDQIQKELDDKYMNNKGLDDVFNDIDNIVKKIESIDPESGSLVSSAWQGAKSGNKIGHFVSNLFGMTAGAALATKGLSSMNAASGAAAGTSEVLAGIGPTGLNPTNITMMAGHVTKAHMAGGGAAAGATAITQTGGGAISSTAVAAGTGGSAIAGVNLSALFTKAAASKAAWSVGGCLGILGIPAAAIGTVAGIEKLINEGALNNADKKALANARLLLPIVTTQLNKQLLTGYLFMSLMLGTAIGYVDENPYILYPSSNDAFHETEVKNIKPISKNRYTPGYMDGVTSLINNSEASFKKTLFNKSQIIIWRFLPKDFYNDAKVLESKINVEITDMTKRIDILFNWLYTIYYKNIVGLIKSNPIWVKVKDIFRIAEKDNQYLNDDTHIKEVTDCTNELLNYLSKHKNFKSSKDSSGSYVKFLQSACRILSSLGAAAASRSAVYFKITSNSYNMQGGLINDIENLMTKIFSKKSTTPPAGTGTGSGAGTP